MRPRRLRSRSRRAGDDAALVHQTRAATAAAFGTYGLLDWAPRAEGSQYTIDLFITEGDTLMVDGKSVYVRTFSPVEGKVSPRLAR